jgi:erythronate-4-phosphate dehydrogenase
VKILADHNIPGLDETFARHGEVCRVDGRLLRREHLRSAQVLIVRSVTPVHSGLLEGTAVRFVGSTTIGTDHMDIPWLEQQGIRWASAPGCNADAASQYTLAMMLLAGQRLGFDLSDRLIGIIGHGNVGSRVHRLLDGCGVRSVRACDPPLAETGVAGLCELEEIQACDIVTLHVPLTGSGPHATLGMVDQEFLSALRPGALLVNTSRGRVVSGHALQVWLASGRGHAALDVWPGEPDIDLALLEACVVGTPHVAGYSLDGKLRGTEMVYAEFCNWLQAPPPKQNLVARPGLRALPVTSPLTVESAILTACPVQRDDAQLRRLATIGADQRPAYFDALRRDYPQRRDFAGWRLPEKAPQGCAEVLEGLGFR